MSAFNPSLLRFATPSQKALEIVPHTQNHVS